MNAADVIEYARRWADLHRANTFQREGAKRVDALLALAEEQAEQIDGMVTKDWHGLRAILDQVYPADVFPTLPDRASRDDGPRIVSLLRNLDRAEVTIARVQELADDPESVKVHAGGGNLVTQRDVIDPDELRAELDGGQP